MERITNMDKIDVFMPTVFKDLNKVEYSIRSLVEYFPHLNNIHISMPSKGEQPNLKIGEHKIFFHNDLDVLPSVNLNECRFRPNWILQQLLKLCQNVTETKNVYIFDSDCILVKQFDAYNTEGKTKLLKRVTSNDESAYFRYMNVMSKGDLCPYITDEYAETNFIADMQIFNMEIIDEMIHRYFKTRDEFIDFTIRSAFWKRDRTTSVFISEYELYGRYVMKYHSDKVYIDNLNMTDVTKYQSTQKQQMFTKEEIENAIINAKNKGFDILKVQSSCGNIDVGKFSRS